MSKMKEDVKKKWVAALRSGEYEQCKQRLKDEKGYCCLGVLCDLYAKEQECVGWVGDTFYSLNDIYNQYGEKYGEDEMLPREVVSWAGLEANNPTIDFELGGDNDETTFGICASDCNDDYGRTFEEIADLIEKNL